MENLTKKIWIHTQDQILWQIHQQIDRQIDCETFNQIYGQLCVPTTNILKEIYKKLSTFSLKSGSEKW